MFWKLEELEGNFNLDMSTLFAYLQTWRFKLSHTKAMTAAFHLHNREAKRELNVHNSNRLLPFRPTPTYLEVKLDILLLFSGIAEKLSSRVALLRRFIVWKWGVNTKTLSTAALSLVS